MAVQQQQGIGTLAYPFYVAEYSRDAKPAPTVSDATLFVLESRETFVWKDGTWRLYQTTPDAGMGVLAGIAADAAATSRKILRELRMIRAGQIAATTSLEVGPETEFADDEQPL